MLDELKKIRGALEYVEFSTHMSCDTFSGKECDSNTKQAYEEQLYLIGFHTKGVIATLDTLIAKEEKKAKEPIKKMMEILDSID